MGEIFGALVLTCIFRKKNFKWSRGGSKSKKKKAEANIRPPFKNYVKKPKFPAKPDSSEFPKVSQFHTKSSPVDDIEKRESSCEDP